MRTRRSKKRVTLNVSGEIFETYEDTLERFPGTLLGERQVRHVYFCPVSQQYFFNRNRICFEAILFFYQSKGILNCPPGVKITIFETECRYFAIPDDFIDSMKQREGIINFGTPPCSNGDTLPLRTKILNILENPDTSTEAWLFGVFSLFMCCLSIIVALVETMPRYRVNPENFQMMELIVNVWFLLEFFLRFVFCEGKAHFMKASMNWIDFFAVVPYFIVEITQLKVSTRL